MTASWRLVDQFSGLAVWVLLAAAIVLLKENRNRKVLLIVLPVIAVNLLWIGIKLLLASSAGMPSGSAALFDVLVAGFTVGAALVLLIAGRFKGMNRFLIVLLAAAVMAAAFALSYIGSRGLVFGGEAIQLSIFFGVITVAAMLALVLAGLFCRRHFGAVKFALWLGAWCVLLCAGMLLSVALTVALVMTALGNHMSVWGQIGKFIFAGGTMGAVVYVFLLPFVVLAISSDLFGGRFYGCFRRKGMVIPQAGVEADVANDRQTT